MQACIVSIQQQTFVDYEVCIVDGNSTDGTQAFLATLKYPFKFISENDHGIYDAMNKGVSLSKGDWLYFLGADDSLYEKETLKNVFSMLLEESSSIISGKIRYTGNENAFIYSKKRKIKTPTWSLLIWIRNSLHHQGTFYKKALFETYRYNLKYKILADYALNIQLYKQKKRCVLIPFFIARCAGSGVSKKGNSDIYKEEILIKTTESSRLFYPLYFCFTLIKYSLRKIVDA